MTTYEDQLKKWAGKRYKIASKDIIEVTLQPEFRYYEGCPTCGPETEETFRITVYGSGSPDEYSSRRKRSTSSGTITSLPS